MYTFYKGTDYWSFTNKKMDRGYPKLISDGWKGIPDNLDAALVWSGNGKTYFFKGTYFDSFSENKQRFGLLRALMTKKDKSLIIGKI